MTSRFSTHVPRTVFISQVSMLQAPFIRYKEQYGIRNKVKNVMHAAIHNTWRSNLSHTVQCHKV